MAAKATTTAVLTILAVTTGLSVVANVPAAYAAGSYQSSRPFPSAPARTR